MPILPGVRAARRPRRGRTARRVRVPPGPGARRSRTTSAAQIPKIEDGPWPAFPADLTSIAVAVATQARGTILIFEKMFENRLFFVDKLVSMGARIILCDPHRAVVTGPAQLYGQRMASPDIRAGMAMLIASAVRGGHLDDRQRRRRSTAATSGSTSACARSARASSGPSSKPGSSRYARRVSATHPGRAGARVDRRRRGRACRRGCRCSTTCSACSRATAVSSCGSRSRPAARTRRWRRPGARSARRSRGRSAPRAPRPRLGTAARRRGARARRRRSVGTAARRLERRPHRAHVGGLRHRRRRALPARARGGRRADVHVRLIEGDDAQHVLAAIFKSLGVALAQAGRPIPRKE